MTWAARRRHAGLPRLVVAAALVVLAALSGTAAADPTPTPSPSVAMPLRVELHGISPLAPQPGQTLVVRGRLLNSSPEPVSELQMRLLVSRSAVGSRGQFDDFAATPDGAPPPDATEMSSAQVALPRTSLAPGASTDFTVSVAVDDLHLPASWQVYEMSISVSGATTLGVDTVGELRTFLPWAPVGQPGTGAPTPLAWIWPVVDRPHRTTSTTWTDDALADAMRPGGRLSVLVSTAAAAEAQHPPAAPKPTRRHRHRKAPPAPPRPTITSVPVTWAVDPMLVQDASAMRSGYTVGTGRDRRPGTGRSAAATWLDSLRAGVAGGSLLGLPYADPDVVAAVRAGFTTSAQKAATIGQALLAQDDSLPSPHGDNRLVSYAWPVDGFSDQRTLDTLFAGGVRTVVLDSNALPVTGGDQSLTPGAHTQAPVRDGRLDVVLVDHRLSSAVDAAAADPSLAALTTQRVLSELLMIQAERPGLPRSVVIAPDRRWAPSTSLAAGLLSGSGRVPWIQPVTVGDVVADPVYDAVQRGPVNYPPEARAAELPRGYLRSTVPLGKRLDAFADILFPATGDSQVRQFDDSLLRLLSSAWRTDRAGAVAARDALAGSIARTMRQVRITTQPDSLVTLTGSSGRVPITVSNELDTPVRVTVVAAADPHLEVHRSAGVTRTIRANTQLAFDLHVTARTRGVASLSVGLFTPGLDARPYSAPVRIRVRSTAYGLEALLITGGAMVVLIVGAAIRLGRRARAARRATRAAT